MVKSILVERTIGQGKSFYELDIIKYTDDKLLIKDWDGFKELKMDNKKKCYRCVKEYSEIPNEWG